VGLPPVLYHLSRPDRPTRTVAGAVDGYLQEITCEPFSA
jgi:hypothetical protein